MKLSVFVQREEKHVWIHMWALYTDYFWIFMLVPVVFKCRRIYRSRFNQRSLYRFTQIFLHFLFFFFFYVFVSRVDDVLAFVECDHVTCVWMSSVLFLRKIRPESSVFFLIAARCVKNTRLNPNQTGKSQIKHRNQENTNIFTCWKTILNKNLN